MTKGLSQDVNDRKVGQFSWASCDKPLTKHATRQRFTCEEYYFDIKFSESYSEILRTFQSLYSICLALEGSKI